MPACDRALPWLTRDQMDLDLPVGIIKQLDVAFAPENYDPEGYSGGDRSGGRSSSSLSNTTWHAILAGGAGLQPDVFFNDAATQSSILAEMQKIGGYTAYRRIGSILRESGGIVGFKQDGDRFRRTTLINSVDTTNPGTSAVTATLHVPLLDGILARIAVGGHNVTTNGVYILVTALDETDTTPTIALNTIASPAATIWNNVEKEVKVNSSAQIRYRFSISGASDRIVINSLGWNDTRGRNS